jgi:hypothetical protein
VVAWTADATEAGSTVTSVRGVLTDEVSDEVE